MKENHRGKLASFFYVGVIPLIITTILIGTALNFMGVPVWKTFQDWGNKLPVISKIIPGNDPTPALAKGSEDSDYWKKQFLKNDEQLKDKDREIKELNNKLSSNQEGIDELKKSNQELQLQLESQKTEESKKQLEQVAAIYKNISPSKAALMLANMPLEEAAFTLLQLDQELQSSIIGSMKDAKQAAQITTVLREAALLGETDLSLLKEQLVELVKKQENPTSALTETIAGMNPVQSASIIQSMMETNSQVALELLKNLTTASRSQILSEIAKNDPNKAAQITANLK
jgi:flagellar motility protein MotE (MotC chaperone)